MIIIKCDFCGKEIETHDTRGVALSQGTVDIIETGCSTCNKATLDAEWESKERQDKLAADWEVQEAEQRNFVESLINNKKAEFEEEEKKKHYGTLYKKSV